MTDSDPVLAALRERYDRVAVREQLHDVPPNEVHLLGVDGRRAVLKRSTTPRGDAGVEGRVQRLVARETGLAPAVLWVGDGAYLAAYDDAARDPETAPTAAWCHAAGRGLARLHSLSVDHHGLFAVDGDPASPAASLRVDADPGARWPDAVDDLLGVFHESVAGTAYADVVAETRSFVRAHADRLAGADPVLVHGWFTPEHVVVDAAPESGDDSTADATTHGVRAVVDFEHAMAGAAAYDLWRLALPTFGPDDLGADWDRFRAAYESVRPLPADFEERATFYRTLVGVSYLDSLATQRGLAGHRDRADAVAASVRDRLADLRAQW